MSISNFLPTTTAATPKERPTLFKPDMIGATLRGDKTETRRLNGFEKINKAPADWELVRLYNNDGLIYPVDQVSFKHKLTGTFVTIDCPYGKAGDRLWAKETFYAYGQWKQRWSDKKGRQEWHFVDETWFYNKSYRYYDSPPGFIEADKKSLGWFKRPSIFMPRAASRLTLEITNVRVERLQNISEQDAIAEGVEQIEGSWRCYLNCPEHAQGYHTRTSATASFMSLWQSINGAESWEASPWVWAVSFKKIGAEVSA